MRRFPRENRDGDDGTANQHDEKDDRTSDKGQLIDRRSVLQATGASLATLGLGAVSGTSVTAETSQPSNYVDLGNQGLQNGDDISPYLEQYCVGGNEVHIPEGTYQWDGSSGLFGTYSDSMWLVGDGNGATLDVGDGGSCDGNVRTASGAGSISVRIENVDQVGRLGVDGSRMAVAAEDPNSLIEFRNFNRPDGSYDEVDTTGMLVDPVHAGTLRLINCHLEEFTNNGLYASGPAKGGDGPVEVYGGLYKNNNVGNVRIGSSDSKVISTAIVNDGQCPTLGGGGNQIGLYLRQGGSNIRIEDCDISHTYDSHGPFDAADSRWDVTGGDCTVLNTRIENVTNNPCIETDGGADVSGDGIELTGSGDLSLDGGPYSNVCSGSGCTSPTTQKRWYDYDGDGTSGGGSTTPEHHLVIDTASDSGIYYTFTTTGYVEGGSDAEVGNNDSITQNSDGTYTVEGETGNGYADDWYFDGDVTEWSHQQHPDESNDDYDLILDGTVVSPSELTGSGDTSVAVSTGSATDVGETTATLAGSLDDLGGADSAEVGFEYRQVGASDWTASATRTLSSTGSFSASIDGLATSTDYEFRAVATASDGDTDAGTTAGFSTNFDHYLVIDTASDSGILYTFTTTGPVEAGPDSEVGNNDYVTDNGDGTYTVEGETGNGYTDDWYFDGDVTEWSHQQHPDASNDDYDLILDGTVVSPSELTGDGGSGGGDTSVAVSTGSAADVGETTATFQGSLDGLGGADSAEVGFEYRQVGASDWTASTTQTLSSAGSFSQAVEGLSSDTDYEFRAVATASDGDTDAGTAVAFTTASSSSGASDPAIDNYVVTEAGSPNPHADISAKWAVSDADEDLSTVLVQVFDSQGVVVEASRHSVGGGVAYDVDTFKIQHVSGETFDVKLTVTDEAGHAATATSSVTES